MAYKMDAPLHTHPSSAAANTSKIPISKTIISSYPLLSSIIRKKTVCKLFSS